ncbi:MAG: DNA primase [Deltaproteobacteria bacterium]|nr:DNA primase [Deltaproteobacteria bacterium]
MIPDDKIAEIRQAARMSEFVSPYVSLKRRGRSLLGLCPFHGEKSPSFSVSDEGGFFHCFGCGAGGNVFKFVMLMENLTFPEAVRKVAAQYGIEVPEEGPGRNTAPERERFAALMASAVRYFRACLAKSGVGDAARAYLLRRGISDEAVERFAIGASPTSGEGLVQWLRRENHDLELAEKLGLVGRRGGPVYDRFRGRLMFPIRDPQGRTVGFGARRLAEGEGDSAGPKYLNSSESPVYHKGRVLYGLFEAREAARRLPPDQRPEETILVEGYLDVVAMSQAGLTNVVATCGTALTVDQARLLRRFGGEVLALFDGDDAGRRAAARSFPVFLEAGLWVRGVFLPQGEDPDSFVRARGVDAMRQALRGAVPLVDAYARDVAGTAGGAAAAARVGAELAEVLRKVENPFEYDVLVKKAAHWTGISERLLSAQGRQPAKRAVGGAPVAATAPAPRANRAGAPAGSPSAEELLVAVLVADAGAIDRVRERDIVKYMREQPWAQVAADLIALREQGRNVDIGEVLATIDQAARARLAGRLLEDSTFEDPVARERLFTDCLERVAAPSEVERKRRMLEEMRRLEELGDDAGAAELLARWKAERHSQRTADGVAGKNADRNSDEG